MLENYFISKCHVGQLECFILDVKFFKDLLVLRKNKFIKLSKRKAINITVNFGFYIFK